MPPIATDNKAVNPASRAKARRVSSISQANWAGTDNRVSPDSRDNNLGSKPTARQAAEVRVHRVPPMVVRTADRLVRAEEHGVPAAMGRLIVSGTAAIPAALGRQA